MQTTALNLVDPEGTLARLMSRIDSSDPDACWLWPGAKDGSGYGIMAAKLVGYGGRYGWRATRTHRLMWHLTKEPIADGMVVDHSCLVRPCCNPAHLQIVTQTENHRLQHLRTPAPETCRKCGASDWKIDGTQRRCRACWNAYHRDYQRRQRSGAEGTKSS